MKSDAPIEQPTQHRRADRDVSIDRLRGLLVVLMVIGNFLADVAFVPDALKHASDIGFTIADLVAPAFVFIIGLNFGPSFVRHQTGGHVKAIQYFATRYLAFVGIGAIISAGSNLVGTPSDWGVMQAIGVAGLVGLLFIQLPAWVRLICGLVLLAIYQYLVDSSMLNAVLGSTHGGLFGAVSWAALLVLSTALGDFWRSGLRQYLTWVSLLSVLAAFSIFFVSVSKHRVSLSYILITLVISALAFALTEAAEKLKLWTSQPGLLSWWGESALGLYLAHLLILAPFVSPNVDWWHAQAPFWLVAIQLLAVLGLLSFIAWRLHLRRNPQIS